MKILHIVPANFECFKDIKLAAFSMVQKLNETGVECHVITLQYNKMKNNTKQEITGDVITKKKGVASSFELKEMTDLDSALKIMDSCDLVHFHFPFFGAGKKILRKLKEKAGMPLLVSYYYSMQIIDLFSIIISIYSQYYISKLIKRSNIITMFPQTYSDSVLDIIPDKKIADISVLEDEERELDLDGIFEIKLNKETIKISLDKLIFIYHTLINSKIKK